MTRHRFKYINDKGGIDGKKIVLDAKDDGMQLDYASEAVLWSEWIKKEYPQGANVASLTLNNDFGKSYVRGFKAAIKGSNIQLVKEEFHEATAPNVTNQMTNIESTLPDVILLETSGVACTQAMAEWLGFCLVL